MPGARWRLTHPPLTRAQLWQHSRRAQPFCWDALNEPVEDLVDQPLSAEAGARPGRTLGHGACATRADAGSRGGRCVQGAARGARAAAAAAAALVPQAGPARPLPRAAAAPGRLFAAHARLPDGGSRRTAAAAPCPRPAAEARGAPQADKVNFDIIVLEQSAELRFNRGALLNAGVLLTLGLDHDYYVFNDVDTLPARGSGVRYAFPEGARPLHLTPPGMHPKYGQAQARRARASTAGPAAGASAPPRPARPGRRRSFSAASPPSRGSRSSPSTATAQSSGAGARRVRRRRARARPAPQAALR